MESQPVALKGLQIPRGYLVELEKYIDEPIVKKALENRYKCWIYLEGEDVFHSFWEWLDDRSYLYTDEYFEPVGPSLVFYRMAFELDRA